MKLRLYDSEDIIYVKADKVDAVIPVKNEKGNFLYSSILINGKEIRVCEAASFIIMFLMKQEMN